VVTTRKTGINDQKEYFKGVPPVWVLYSIVLSSFNGGVFLVNGLRHWESDPSLHVAFVMISFGSVFVAIFSGLRLLTKLERHQSAETESNVNANGTS
jgi:hypothetical protein